MIGKEKFMIHWYCKVSYNKTQRFFCKVTYNKIQRSKTLENFMRLFIKKKVI